MAITVRLPAALRVGMADTIVVDEPARTIADLVEILERRLPGLHAQLDDSVFNFAINDEIVLYQVRGRTLEDGDVVEIIPTISGGASGSAH